MRAESVGTLSCANIDAIGRQLKFGLCFFLILIAQMFLRTGVSVCVYLHI